MKSQFSRVLRNKLSGIVLLAIVLIPCMEIIQLLSYEKVYLAEAFFLSGSTIGHVTQIILLWFLPLYLLVICSDDPIQDKKTGVRDIWISKLGKRNYFLVKLKTSFIVSFSVIFLALTINFLINSLIFDMAGFSSASNYDGVSGEAFLKKQVESPYLSIFLFSLTTSFFAGLIGAAGTCFSMLTYDKKITYPVTFAFWYILISNKGSVMYLFQPFAEYGLETLVPIFITSTLAFLVLYILTYLHEVKINEI
ncbi:hypothetical protein GW626_22365 [Peribacillus muralis]|uniref:hypothetical protein n=1 Tax=Peribacillus muralis TaxID=264697 RepID=UPI001F4ED2A1|nr:hypothetical protein [Peribacillus muralis]MCK1994631.1 hypothetical protein [Peribacillus muralis]MCK2015134.1 hypothetical protein [Peribacillus muralis]